LSQIRLRLRYCTDGMAKPLAKYIGESSTLRTLELNWAPAVVETNDSSPMSQAGFSSICEGIGKSTYLHALVLSHTPDDDEEADMAARSVALALSKSKSLNGSGVTPVTPRNRTFLEKVRSSLVLTPTVQNFDVCVRENEDERSALLFLDRNVPWKPLLSKDIPLALWARILAKANTWNQYVSHTPLDALYFLIREKNDVLLHNVHCRKIQKRRKRGLSPPCLPVLFLPPGVYVFSLSTLNQDCIYLLSSYKSAQSMQCKSKGKGVFT
jgi:hypothetical protein